ncbi:hypothetical protein DC487_14300 [Sphingobacterium corticibacter]|uniref:Uncharacterized protein n=1 Tax=Sphingobacterium corticibacter TaxID=2171749 RepID=A0A2T8HFS3_9SPHI|nr:hypothetical protein DC487_14300 [Sphingobacterium corticibacter]
MDAKKTRTQLWDWITDKIGKFSAWCKPDPDDSKWVQIGKSILKIPIILFVLACSPVMLIVAGLIFFLML